MIASCSTRLKPPPIVGWLEDETFYSLCGRQHCVLGNATPSQTLAWLFGSPTATTAHDFPTSLGALNDRARSTWGTPLSIILEHTILPLFFPFRSDQDRNEALRTLEGPSLGSIKYRLGLLTSKFGAEHPLKACISCIKSDQHILGVAYWHRSHQYPGVLICPIHCEPLRESTTNRQWSGRFQWSLPSESTLSPERPHGTPENAIRALEQIGKAVRDLAACGASRRFDPHTVATLYQAALGICPEDSTPAFARYCAVLRPYPPFTELPGAEGQVAAFWTRLLRPRKGYSHPLKHLVAISYLYGSVSAFVEAYDRAATGSATKGQLKATPSEVSSKPELAATEMRAPVRRKPKVLRPLIRAEILHRLRYGASKRSLCDEFQITISTVNKLLRAEPDTRQSWLKACRTAKIAEQRSVWKAMERHIPNGTPKDVRNLIPATYAWLYRNDQNWLLARTQKLVSGRQGNNSRIDWSTRDETLLSLVQQKASDLRKADLKVCKTALFQACPTLAAKLEKRGRYTRTRAFLKTLE